VKNQRKNQKTISIKKKKNQKSKNQTHQSKTHQKKSKNKVDAVGLGGRPDPSRLDPSQLWVYTMGLGGRPDPGQPDPGQLYMGLHRGSADSWHFFLIAFPPTAGHQFHPPTTFLLPSSSHESAPLFFLYCFFLLFLLSFFSSFLFSFLI
jgi:hypothetical protein